MPRKEIILQLSERGQIEFRAELVELFGIHAPTQEQALWEDLIRDRLGILAIVVGKPDDADLAKARVATGEYPDGWRPDRH